MECSCSGDECKTCGEFKTRPFEFRIYRVKGLNKPFTRSGIAFGKVLHIIDSTIGIVTFGYFVTNLSTEWIRRDLKKFFQYNINGEDEHGGHKRFKLRPFEFRVYNIRCISKPWTRPEKIFGHMLQMIDAMIGIATFAHFESFLYTEWNSRSLNKLGQFIEKHGIDTVRSSK